MKLDLRLRQNVEVNELIVFYYKPHRKSIEILCIS